MKIIGTHIAFEENVGFVPDITGTTEIITPISFSISVVESFDTKQIIIHNIRKAEPDSIDVLIGYSLEDWKEEKKNYSSKIIQAVEEMLTRK